MAHRQRGAGHHGVGLYRARRRRRAADRLLLARAPSGGRTVGRQQQWVYHSQPEEFPPDFPQRLDRFRQAAGMSWRGLSRQLKVNSRTVRRWKAGAKPGSGHLVSLFSLAAGLGLLHHLLPEAGKRRAKPSSSN